MTNKDIDEVIDNLNELISIIKENNNNDEINDNISNKMLESIEKSIELLLEKSKYSADNIKNVLYGYKTRYDGGFTRREIERILKVFPKVNKDKFNYGLSHTQASNINNELVVDKDDIEEILINSTE